MAISAATYILGALALIVLVLSLAFSAVRLRRCLLPTWSGAPAHLVEVIVAVALLVWLGEVLGTFNLLYAWSLVASALLLAGTLAWLLSPPTASPAGGVGVGCPPPARSLRRARPRPWNRLIPLPGADRSARRAPSPATGPAGQPRSSLTQGEPPPPATEPAGQSAWSLAIAVGVIAVVFAHWGLTAKDALDRGIFNFDSLWYHMPFAVEMAHSHSVTGLHYTETVFTNWFYPQSSELLHAVGILLTQRDTLSLFLNFGWLAVAFLAAWCIGRPYGRGHLTVAAAAIVLECHTLVVREPGAAKNDLMAAALLLAAIAILVEARAAVRREAPGPGEAYLPVGWPLAAAGLAAGLAVGTKSTAVAMAAALTVAVVALAPAGRRPAATAWWLLPAFAAGGFWYLRNLVVAGNPLPQLEGLGPIPLPHPERLQSGRPDFSIVHYATDPGVWHEYFAPGLHQAFGLLWPLVVGGAVAGGLLALVHYLRATRTAASSLPDGGTARRGGDRILAWLGAAALFGLLAYLFTPLSAAGAEGAPTGFAINIRYAIPALLAGLVLLPLALPSFARPSTPAIPGEAETSGASAKLVDAPGGRWPEWALLAALLAVLLVTDRPDAVLRDPGRLFGLALAALFVLVPAGIAWASTVLSSRSLPAGGAVGGTAPEEASATAGGGGSPAATGPAGQPRSSLTQGELPPPATEPAGRRRWLLALAVIALGLALAIGYPIQRDYLNDRFANRDPDTAIPGMHLDSAYRWARDVHDARIGLAGTTAGFLQYGFYGADLSNRVRYLGAKGPHGAFNAIPGCRGFRAAVDAARLDYLVTAPFLNFIHPDRPIASPEAGWLRGEPAVTPVQRSGPVTVWRVRGGLNPAACGPANAPLRRIPQQPPT